jgi:hypothetical protein
MSAFHAHDDDFLFQIKYPPTNEEPKESRKSSAADELLERFLRRLRIQSPFTLRLQPQPQPQPGVVGMCIYPEIVRAPQSMGYLAKDPRRPRVHRVWPYKTR